jgi:hypothetical protein
MACGAYSPGGGTTYDHMGDLLHAYGIQTESSFGATLDDVRDQLNEGHKVIVAVDSSVLWDQHVPGHHGDHAVQLVAVDDTDKDHPKVILNDPGSPDGQGVVVDAGKFFEMWGSAGNFMMHTDDVTPGGISSTASLYTPSLSGYYNGDGTYHWETDNTNRDPNNGTIVSWSNKLGDHEWERGSSGFYYEKINGDYTGNYTS